MSEFKAAALECDIVMKGGITSGVVYPLTVIEIARKYRLRNIGGTSAGALAAAITAAAEFNRDNGGFERIQKIPGEVATRLLGFFQPVPKLKPVFDVLLAMLAKQAKPVRIVRALGAIAFGYWPWTLLGLLPGLMLAAYLACGLSRPATCWEWVLAALVAVSGVIVALGVRLARVVRKDLPANDFGLCTGMTVGRGGEGLTNWLERTIDEVAGRKPEEGPVTFADLQGPDENNPKIRLEMMTTNLSMQRAHRLPLRTRIYYFREEEFARLFSPRLVKFLIQAAEEERDTKVERIPGFHQLPQMKLPIVVAARMSLSFPGLICTVPLHACDYTLKDDAARKQPRRCVFSDGGITSNFPIHFFDRFLPCTPTFAVTLDSWRREQHGEEHVHLPQSARSGIVMPVRPIDSFGGFLMSIVDSAKGWQDNLQSTLPGYRERIVHVALDDDNEGGLNLAMDEATIQQLVRYGELAGKELVGKFDLDEHRWRRFLVAMARLERTLDTMQASYETKDATGQTWKAFLEEYSKAPDSYKQSAAWRAEALARMETLMTLAKAWRTSPTFQSGEIPKPSSDLRITPRY